MTKAPGFYNILLEPDEPALVIGAALTDIADKEKIPHIGEFNEPWAYLKLSKKVRISH